MMVLVLTTGVAQWCYFQLDCPYTEKISSEPGMSVQFCLHASFIRELLNLGVHHKMGIQYMAKFVCTNAWSFPKQVKYRWKHAIF